jgi:hypothetical protein
MALEPAAMERTLGCPKRASHTHRARYDMNRKLLVAYSMTSTHVQTTLDYLRALKTNLGYDATYIHVTHDAVVEFDFAAAGYDIVFHNYCSRFCFENYVSASYREQLTRFGGLKVMAVQDEYDNTDRLKVAIKECGFHIVLTCVPQDSLEYVYPRREFPNVEFITVFTGYVPDGFAEAQSVTMPLAERPIVVGYRGRDIGPRYGRLGLEKFEVGRRMKEICDARGVVNDIAMDEASRIYGTAWFDFVGRCRAMLGSESGSNVFDFDGKIAAELARMKERLGRMPTHTEFQPFVAKRDGEINMGQISPRVFECAVMRTPMILLRGRYSDAIQPDVHYIPLDLDFSNAGEVLRRLEDLPALEAMTDRAHRHLVASGRFGYRALCDMLALRFERRLAALARPATNEQMVISVETGRPDSRREILSEVPTDEPKGMAEFLFGQLRLTGVQNSWQLRQMDQLYTKAMADCLNAVSILQNHHDKLTRRSWPVFQRSQGDDAADAAHCADALRKSHRSIALERESIRVERATIEEAICAARTEGRNEEAHNHAEQLAALDARWIGSYAAKYEAFYAQYRREFDRLQNSTIVLAHRPGIPALVRAYQMVENQMVTLVARARGSKLELAKAIVRRMPGGRTIALAVLRLRNWIH